MNRATDPKVVDAEALRGPVVGDFQPGRLRLQTLALMRYEPSTTLFHNRAVDGIRTGAPAAFEILWVRPRRISLARPYCLKLGAPATARNITLVDLNIRLRTYWNRDQA